MRHYSQNVTNNHTSNSEENYHHLDFMKRISKKDSEIADDDDMGFKII